jgi:hypothetical protein
VVGVVGAWLLSGRATALVGVGSLLLLAVPTPNLLVLGGATVFGASLVALIGVAHSSSDSTGA